MSKHTNENEMLMNFGTNIEYYSSDKEAGLPEERMTMPIENLLSLGVAFEPLTQLVQTAISGSGRSGIYFVNTHGKTMFQLKGSSNYIGSLKTATNQVGGGQATMKALPCNPAMLFMAATLMTIEKKLDAIQKTQQDILAFLEQREIAKLRGNLNVLTDVLNNYKFNWDNEKYKDNKHILVQEIKKESEQSILLYRDQIAETLKKRSLFYSDQKVKDILKKLQNAFSNYQMALYVYSFSSFLEILLLENFSSDYLESVSKRMEKYAYHYRQLYTESYNIAENCINEAIQTKLKKNMGVASRTIGSVIAKTPVINKTQIDEKLVDAGEKVEEASLNKSSSVLKEFTYAKEDVTRAFIENIKTINKLSNTTVKYYFDESNIYIG